MERGGRLGNPAQPRRHDVSQIARRRQGRPERKEGAGLDAGAASHDQASGARSRRQVACWIQAGGLCEGSLSEQIADAKVLAHDPEKWVPFCEKIMRKQRKRAPAVQENALPDRPPKG